MQTELAKLDNNRVELTIEVAQDVVAKAIDQGAKKLAGRVNIPGFRKGKAPRAILERYVGKGAILEEAFDILYPDALLEAVKEKDVAPIDRPEVSDVQMEEGQPCKFKVIIEVMPEVKLGQYKGLEVSRTDNPVTDADVDEFLAQMRERSAELVPAEEGAELSDGRFGVIDFEGYVNDVPFQGGAGKDVMIEAGAGRFLPDFEKQLVGAKAGEDREVRLTFPEDYHAKHLAGQEARFEVKVKEVKEKRLPALDDEFARAVSDFPTLDELKADIKKNLTEEREKDAQREVEQELISLATKNAEVEIPAKLIERRVEVKVADFAQRLQAQGFSLDDYFTPERTVEDLKKELKADAEFEVKTRLVLEAIVKAEGVKVTEEDAEAKLLELAKGNEDEKARMKHGLVRDERWESYLDQLAVDRVVEEIVSSATITTGKAPKGKAEPKKRAPRAKKGSAE